MSRKALALLVLTTAVCMASTSAAQVTARFCMGWQTNLADTQLGEDRLTPTPNTWVDEQAYYTWASIYYKEDPAGSLWTTQWTGALDSEGCTPYMSIHNWKNYRFKRRSYLVRSDRKIWLQPSVYSTWGDYYSYDDCDMFLGALPGTYTFGSNCDPTPHFGNFRMMPIYSTAMQYATTIGMPTDMVTSVSTNNSTLCEGTGYLGISNGRHRICVNGVYHVNQKFIQMHEFGHAVARANNGPRRGNYYADRNLDGSAGAWFDTDPNDMCNCDGILGSHYHCLHSREHIGAAAKEGYAHFISSAVFNARSMETGGNRGFGYYMQVRESSGTIVNPPYAVNISPDSLSEYEQRMEEECNPATDGFEHLGTEWDWLQFFWAVYADSSTGGNLSIPEINDVWDSVDDFKATFCCSETNCYQCFSEYCYCQSPYTELIRGKTWDDVMGSVEYIFGEWSDEAKHFDQIGEYAGVSY